MAYFICAIIGYLCGCVSPSYLLGKIKKIDLRKSGTNNLGASNTFINLGRGWGIFVMFFDILKSLFAVILCRILYNDVALAPLISGTAAVIGHNYPFYLQFRGGKGLASFGGFVLAISPVAFAVILVLCACLALLLNYGCVMALLGALIFPIIAALKFKSIAAFFITMLSSFCVIIKHTENLRRIRSGEERRLREFISRYVFKHKN